MNLEKPTYTTVQPEGLLPVFVSSLVFSGVTYTGDAGRNKKEAEQLAARAVILSILGNNFMLEIVPDSLQDVYKHCAACMQILCLSVCVRTSCTRGYSTRPACVPAHASLCLYSCSSRCMHVFVLAIDFLCVHILHQSVLLCMSVHLLHLWCMLTHSACVYVYGFPYCLMCAWLVDLLSIFCR